MYDDDVWKRQSNTAAPALDDRTLQEVWADEEAAQIAEEERLAYEDRFQELELEEEYERLYGTHYLEEEEEERYLQEQECWELHRRAS